MRRSTIDSLQFVLSGGIGTALTLTNAIDGCYLPANEPDQLIFYGLSQQNGTPTPQAPLTVNYVSGTATAGNTNIALPDMHSVGDYADTFEPCVWVNGAYRSRKTQRFYKIVLTGLTGASLSQNSSTANYSYNINTATTALRADAPAICSHFLYTGTYSGAASGANRFSIGSTRAFYFNLYGIVSADNSVLPNANEANAWLQAQNTAGNPVTVYYPLIDPIVTLGDPVMIPQVPGTTSISTNSTVKGQIKASVLIPRS